MLVKVLLESGTGESSCFRFRNDRLRRIARPAARVIVGYMTVKTC